MRYTENLHKLSNNVISEKILTNIIPFLSRRILKVVVDGQTLEASEINMRPTMLTTESYPVSALY